MNFDEMINLELENLPVKEYIRKELLNFYQKIKEVVSHNNSINFDLIVDNMSKRDSKILISYVTNIVEKMGLFTNFINFKEYMRRDYRNCVVIIDEIDDFENEFFDTYRGEQKLTKFYTDAKTYNNMIIFTCPDKIDNHSISLDPFLFDIKQCIHISGNDSKKEMYEKLLSRYKVEKIIFNIPYNTFVNICNELEKNKYVKNYDIVDYIFDYSLRKMILNNRKEIDISLFKDIINKEDENQKETQLENLVGLDNIKKQLDTLYNYLEFSKRKKFDKTIYLNLFFLGNPGTGKTTVARMYAKKLFELGFIKEDKLVEIVPNDLMGEYVGQTRRKTRSILNDAENGVLFIDEAYLLYTENYSKGKNPYMEEAVVELIKYLEDPKNIVIFAGYPSEMRKIYDSNPGLKSRIYDELMFDDYSSEELYDIFKLDLKSKGLSVDKRSKNKIIDYINSMKDDKNFGNARSMKQLAQRMTMNYANGEMKNINISYKNLPKTDKENKNRMGFSVYDR